VIPIRPPRVRTTAVSISDVARALTLDPRGNTLVVAGNSQADDSADWATVAYVAGTGAELWSARHNGTGSGLDIAWDLAVTPDPDWGGS